MDDIQHCSDESSVWDLIVGLGGFMLYVIRTPPFDASSKNGYRASVKLPKPGLMMTLSADCQYAAVAHSYFISIVNIRHNHTLSIKTWHTGVLGVSGLVYADSGIVYIAPSYGQWTPIVCINAKNGTKGSCDCGNYGGSRIYGTKYGLSLYMLTTGLSPQTFTKFTYTNGNTCMKKNFDAPGWGPSYGHQLWFSRDGSRMISDIGKVISTTDLVTKGNLNDSSLLWMEADPKGSNNLYVLSKTKKWITIYR